MGKTFWQSIDSSAVAVISAEGLKHAFTRARPRQSDDPDQWFQGRSHYSFPSEEVAAVSAIVTPFVLEYHQDQPAVYALALLPAYDAIARMKAQAHWQTDVLAGAALGGLAGYYAHNRESPFILSVLPHGFTIGLKKQFYGPTTEDSRRCRKGRSVQTGCLHEDGFAEPGRICRTCSIA